MTVAVDVGSPLPGVTDHVEEAKAVRLESAERRCAVVAVEAEAMPCSKRLTLTERRPQKDVRALSDFQERYLLRHQARQFSSSTASLTLGECFLTTSSTSWS